MKSIVTQTLVSIQGEGFGVGKPVLLIRFGGCNLVCSFCDSSWTNESVDCNRFWPLTNYNTPFIIDENNIQEYIDYIQTKLLDKYNIKTVLFTGGEPFQNIDFIRAFINITKDMKYFDNYEIETNGTLIGKNKSFLSEFRDNIQLNISPKVSEYRDLYTVEFKTIVDWFYNLYDTAKLKNSFLKFVYSKDMESDILSFIKKFQPKNPICMTSLTPQNGTKDFLEIYRKNCLDTLEFCLKTGYTYSPREHVFLFGDNREEFESLKTSSISLTANLSG